MPTDVLLYGVAGEALLSAPRRSDSPDAPIRVRVGSRGEQFALSLFNAHHALAMEGSLFVAQTATPGTGITLTSATGTTYSDTQGILVVDNIDSNPATGGQGKRIYLLSVSFVVTAAPVATTLMRIAHRMDKAARGSAGTALTAVNVNSGFSGSSIAGVRTGVPTIAAATNNIRNLGQNTLRASIGAVGDVYTIVFGGIEGSTGQGLLSGTTALHIVVPAPPIVIEPGWSYVMNEWSTARTAAMSGEVVVAWAER